MPYASNPLSCQSSSALSLRVIDISCLFCLISVLLVIVHPACVIVWENYLWVCDCLGSRSVVCRSDISMKFVASCHLLSNLFFTLNFYRLLFAWCMNYPSLCCTSCCFFHNLLFACLFLSFSVINCLASFFSLNHSFPLGFPIVSLPVLHHLISPSLPSSIIFCLSFPSPSLLISTSDEHWEVDSLASMCSHFMVWLKNWEKGGKKGKSGRDAILERIIERAKVSTAKVEIQKRGGLKWESGRNREKVKEDICFWTLPVHDGKPIQKQRLYHCLQYAHFRLTKRHLPLSCFGSLFVSRSLIKGQHHLLHTVFMVLLMCLFFISSFEISRSVKQKACHSWAYHSARE